jgi:hypothetical protein
MQRPKTAKSKRFIPSAEGGIGEKIPAYALVKLVDSMPRRFEAVIQTNGFPRKY